MNKYNSVKRFGYSRNIASSGVILPSNIKTVKAVKSNFQGTLFLLSVAHNRLHFSD